MRTSLLNISNTITIAMYLKRTLTTRNKVHLYCLVIRGWPVYYFMQKLSRTGEIFVLRFSKSDSKNDAQTFELDIEARNIIGICL